MLHSTGCLAADDVSIRCRVRHSPNASGDRVYSEPQEMVCTLRSWHKTNNPAGSVLTKPINMKKSRSFGSPGFGARGRDSQSEIILQSIESNPMIVQACCSTEAFQDPLQLTDPFLSYGSISGDVTGRSSHTRTKSQGGERSSYRLMDGGSSSMKSPRVTDQTVPITDVLVVDMNGNGDSHRTYLTTLSHGYFELTMENRNGQEVLFAFLKASLPQERIMGGQMTRSPSFNTTSTGSRSFDVEAFTASRMADTMANESLTEKIRRKVGRVVMSIEEISTAFSDCASCGCGGKSVAPLSPQSEVEEKRDSPPRSRGVEFAANSPQYRKDMDAQRLQERRELFKKCNLPSGLSVEHSDDPEMESTGY